MTLPCLNHFTNVLLFINHICVKRTSKVNVDSESPFTSSWLCIDSQSDKPSAFMHDEQNLNKEISESEESEEPEVDPIVVRREFKENMYLNSSP